MPQREEADEVFYCTAAKAMNGPETSASKTMFTSKA